MRRICMGRILASLRLIYGRLLPPPSNRLPALANIIECVMGHAYEDHPMTKQFHAIRKNCPVCGAPLSRVMVTTTSR